MKKGIILFAVFCLLGTTLQSQTGPNRRGQLEERIEAQRIAFITQRLQLTAEESRNFWPLYNEYEDQLKTLRDNERPKSDIMNMSEAEAEAFLNASLAADQRELDLKRKYLERFKSVLPVKKVAMLGHVERAFNRELVRRIQEHRRK